MVFNDELYLLGGQGTAEVWGSPNGRDWTRLSAEADWGRATILPAYRDDRMWVFGGWKDRSTNAVNDVWYLPDGRNWSRQTDHAPWAPRSPIAVVFQDKIWIYSGKHWVLTTTGVATCGADDKRNPTER